ncbi:MAG: DUF3450 family protein [Pseudomonadota bacterium]
MRRITRRPAIKDGLGLVTGVSAALILAGIALPERSANADEPWREVDQLVRQWNSLERQHSTLAAGWREREPLLRLQLELLEQERKSLQLFIDSRRTASDEVDQRRIELAAEQVTFEANQRSLNEALLTAETALQATLPRMPPPLQQMWRDELAIAASPGSASASERLQTVISLLSAAVEFDRRVTVHRTTMPNADGQPVEVRELYLGLAQGWYLSADRALVGSGYAADEQWRWAAAQPPTTPLADALAAAFDMLDNPALAAPVALPISIPTGQP